MQNIDIYFKTEVQYNSQVAEEEQSDSSKALAFKNWKGALYLRLEKVFHENLKNHESIFTLFFLLLFVMDWYMNTYVLFMTKLCNYEKFMQSNLTRKLLDGVIIKKNPSKLHLKDHK